MAILLLAILLLAILLAACGGPAPAAMEDAGIDAAPPEECGSDDACDDGLACTGIEVCRPGVPFADERGCVSQEPLRCRAGQVCSEREGRCITTCAALTDADGDGSSALECGGDDCDDADPDRAPGAIEVCDAAGRDEDCDPDTFGDRDADGDGGIDAACCNGERCGADCDDANRLVGGSLGEICDTLDNDCDDAIDEDARAVTWYVDGDFDGWGSAEAGESCTPIAGAVPYGGDCDDTQLGINPLAREDCDRIDEDCDGTFDESIPADRSDSDGDGVRDSCDLCPGESDVPDADGDGIPDACDPAP